MDLRWWTIEVLGGADRSAALWHDVHGNVLVEAAIAHGAYDWAWRRQSWGLIFEIGFRADDRFGSFRDLPAVRAALDAVPDPVNGLLIYPGRGGSAGQVLPRHPRPRAGAGAAPIPREPSSVRVALAAAEPPPTRAGVGASIAG
ncbi:hypothetical protein [Actinoplanes sp. NPDC023714]|uniref:hypothetical protein n=1 Tax=Actinoplanes sp. NPDC023714 TaxID=3154322 RepID=UPI0033CAAF88